MSLKRRRISEYEIRNPDKVLSNLLSDYIEGRLDESESVHRAVVVEIDHIGGIFETQPGNPRGSIRARIVSDASDKYTSNEDLSVYWPINPFHLLPIKEGEHVYVMFEDENREHGLWLTRIPEPKEVESKNYTPGFKKFVQFSDGRVTDSNAESIVQDSDDSVPHISTDPNFVLEATPEFISRTGDHNLYGSNNTLISLGSDRITTVDTGLTSNAGTIDIVSGRVGEDLDLATDKSRIYISSNTDADTNFNISAGTAASASPTIIIKSDQIRIIARNGSKIINEAGDIIIQTPGDITIEGANINVGLNAQQSAVLGDKLSQLLNDVLTAIQNHTHPTAMGPAGPSVDLASSLPTNIGNLSSTLSKTVKIKE